MQRSILEHDAESSIMNELRDYAATVPVELVEESTANAAPTVQAMLEIEGDLLALDNFKAEQVAHPKGWGASADDLDSGINISEIDLSGDLFKKYFS